ncbi:hypothetical protein AUEXF2481DRAFT_30114 [Aureobasidium subglaciale EXF-2481]|uniref:Uncharacterized protein n=1 Tax=Aureobasidium subglaciale (strain EXF-2481) TaxID=1043005 RepID=A0A074YFC3_AURSE|nr:uncharacterized protein AUEXF2481DRAFT_30114 [Aureobasidium subglaciale EXF-2481]KAI5212450.1 hypothetical protein E4T38_00481 [Aureobasidium subglaciale]KAI5231559.1 hypothetical protein E4T40_00423 [Aureobasidium subglaciale]KAI5234507.1 hypothetical protein E4T41_00480 [Aureobasidium subglaciale]KAI5267832.1 hypothetical protein E4T46_00480 [Aureobasidium subglaciale]KEQ94749.1 hypothetical protein AUEXF2481DRAFT_30114 [Aureobasidium subglaciale EXF-2481]
MSSPNQYNLSDPTSVYHISQTSRNDPKNPRHAALSSAFPEQFFAKKTSSISPPIPTSPTTSPTTQKPTMEQSRQEALEEMYPVQHFGKRSTSPSTTSTEKQLHRSPSVYSTSSTLTATSAFSTTSTATTIAAPPAPKDTPIDLFDYQVAGYLSMPISHKDQPYRKHSASASSTSSSSSLWTRAKGKLQRKPSSNASEDEDEKMTKTEKKQQREREYAALGLDEKVKFGAKGGMNIVG